MNNISIYDRQIIASEGIIRRSNLLPYPVMLKGSYLTRQYMPSLDMRIAGDLDFVYLRATKDEEEMEALTTEWLAALREVVCDDGMFILTEVRSLSMDRTAYFMDEDFPTMRAYLECKVNEERVYFLQVDISFNLHMPAPPVPLAYRCWDGSTLQLSSTVPLGIQVAWKLHQLLVRLRPKDIYDLTHILRHPQFDAVARALCLQTLVDECATEGNDPRLLRRYLDGHYIRLLQFQEQVQHYPHTSTTMNEFDLPMWEYRHYAGGEADVPKPEAFLADFLQAMNEAGLGLAAFDDLPAPTVRKKG